MSEPDKSKLALCLILDENIELVGNCEGRG